MRNLSSTKGWKILDADLRAATGRDFERVVLPLLRAFWPTMVQPPAMKHYDRRGVDLVEFSESGITCAVQCKGVFKIEGLADDQFAPISKSIAAFRESTLTTDEYVILHNQDGRNRGIASRIDRELATLVDAGRAKRVRQWDRHAFLKALQEQLWKMIGERVREQSAFMLAQMNDRFDTGGNYVVTVPLRERRLLLRRGSRPRIEQYGPARTNMRVADALLKTKERWTLLTGLFGSGKTTAALTAAHRYPDAILYVPAASLEPRGGEVGTNTMMTRILNALGIFADFEDDDRLIFERLGAAMLRKDLSANDAATVLILDGIDENRSLAGPTAMMHFASALAELRCPIILTTREEHFRATFGNFDHFFEELSSKGIPRKIRLIELDAWDTLQIIELVESTATSDPNNDGLAALLAHVRRGETGGWNEEMLRHPLFLRMILELAADGAEPASGRAEIIGTWVWHKLTRDLRVDRPTPVEVLDRDAFIETMETLMERVAGAMTESAPNGETLLVEALPSTEVLAITSELLHATPLNLGSVLGVTLLIPTAVRYRGAIPIRFTHRVFQEYFLARHLSATGRDAKSFPQPVQAFWRELSPSKSDFA